MPPNRRMPPHGHGHRILVGLEDSTHPTLVAATGANLDKFHLRETET